MPAMTVPSPEPPRHPDFGPVLQFYLIDCTTRLSFTADPDLVRGGITRPSLRALGLLLMTIIFFLSSILHASDAPVIPVGRFSAMAPGSLVPGWEAMTFDKIDAHTRYTLVTEAGRTVLRADSHASASGLVRKIQLDPEAYPVLTWSWKVTNVIEHGDLTKKSGDDYPARIYITFAEDPEQVSFFQRAKMAAIKTLYGTAPPSAALAYVWANRSEVGSVHPNPFTGRVQMIVVESGPAQRYQWRSFRRDVVKDFRRAFGVDPPRISGIAVMTDSDNTGESATAWYGDIELRRRIDN